MLIVIAATVMSMKHVPVSLCFLAFSITAMLGGCATAQRATDAERGSAVQRFVQHSVNDYRRHYDTESLLDLLAPLAAAGTLANTDLDRRIHDRWRDDVRSRFSDEAADVFQQVGDAAQNRWSMPLYSLTMIASGYSGYADEDSAPATWAERSLRANVLGAPQAWAFTYLLGSHRPEAGVSDWDPWNDNDGVSGHSFYGAVPFLTAARMTDSTGWRYGLYALSMLPAYARLNDGNHYTSQAVMGWSIAWLATRTIAEDTGGNDATGDRVSLLPILTPDGGFVLVSIPF